MRVKSVVSVNRVNLSKRVMNLLGAIVEYQNSLLQLYRKFEERFEENSVIRTLWRDAAGDVELQIQSLKSFPPSLWNQVKNDQDGGFEPVVKAVKEGFALPANAANISLRDCFETSLQLAEPVILKIYARVIRLLRKNSTAPALNFYILVKAYVARLVRTTESFSGDPMLIRRAQALLAGLEKEVQEPARETKASKSNALSAKTQKADAAGKENAKAAKGTATKPHGNVKSASPESAKTASVKAQALLRKTPAAAKRAKGNANL